MDAHIYTYAIYTYAIHTYAIHTHSIDTYAIHICVFKLQIKKILRSEYKTVKKMTANCQ